MIFRPDPSTPTLVLVEPDAARAERVAAALEAAWLLDLGIALVGDVPEACGRLSAREAGCVIAGAGSLAHDPAGALGEIRRADASVPVIAVVPEGAGAVDLDAIVRFSDEQLPEAELTGVSIGRAIRYATERKHSELQLAYETLHDPLTGLPNRRRFVEGLETALAGAGGEAQVAVCLLDLDDFALVTNEAGHDAGDEILFEIGGRLQAGLRGADLVARYGGDEFAVLGAIAADSEATELARRAVAIVAAEQFEANNTAVCLSARAGVSVSGGERDPGILLSNAEAALVAAKRAQEDVVLYRHEMRAGPLRRLQLRTEMEAALGRDEFRVFYQPQVRLPDRRVTGVEALLRWEHPARGHILPGEFVELAEETGLIVPIAEHVLATACADAARFGPAPFTVSINLSARQLKEPHLVEAVGELVEAAGVDPGQLCMEMTETMAMACADSALRALLELKALGMRLALDDFGKGYSSLSRLDRLPIDILKIDRAFITGIDADPRKRRIIGAISGLAEGLELNWLAEGVEHEGEVAALEQLGCELVQGFYFGLPRPVEEFVREYPAAVTG